MVPIKGDEKREDDDLDQVYGDMFEKLRYGGNSELEQSDENQDEQDEPASEWDELIKLNRENQRKRQRNRKESRVQHRVFKEKGPEQRGYDWQSKLHQQRDGSEKRVGNQIRLKQPNPQQLQRDGLHFKKLLKGKDTKETPKKSARYQGTPRTVPPRKPKKL